MGIKEKKLIQIKFMLWKILNLLIDFYLFTFSNTEICFFKRMLPFKLKGVNDQGIFQTLNIVNVQRRDFEGLIPGLYSLDETIYKW